MLELLLQNLKRNKVILEPPEITLLQNYCTFRQYRKNQYILQEGDICRYETFIISGITRMYHLNEEGHEHVLFFAPEDWWIGDLYSFLSHIPSRYNIDCLEKTQVLQINFHDLNELYEKVPKMNQYFRVLFQNAFIAATERVTATQSKTSLQRYIEFKLKYPEIEQRIPNHQIASFLGITPQSLSRLRRKLLAK